MNTSRKLLTRKSPANVKRWVKRYTQPIGGIKLGPLRRLDPISNNWGFDRGLPIDRYYIESFLKQHATDIKGRTLEVANNIYTKRFGGDRVTKSDVLHDRPGSSVATLVADLAQGGDLPESAFDCVICTQTLHLIYDLTAAIATLHRILKPGGVLLATVPSISRISSQDMARTGDYWRFTDAAVRKLFAESFNEEQLDIDACGNVLAAISFLHGLAAQELSQDELNHTDENFQVLITIRAVK